MLGIALVALFYFVETAYQKEHKLLRLEGPKGPQTLELGPENRQAA